MEVGDWMIWLDGNLSQRICILEKTDKEYVYMYSKEWYEKYDFMTFRKEIESANRLRPMTKEEKLELL